jgi:hypothetical protein
MNARPRHLLALVAGALAFGFGGGAAAQAPAGTQPTAIGTFKDWSAYAAPVKGGRICYALAQPEPQRSRRRSQAAPREGAYFFISNRPQEGVFNEVSVMPGFTLKPNSEVDLTVDGDEFKMYVRGDGAFMSSNEEQAKLVQAMREARRSIRVVSTPTRGRAVTDSYSVSGIAAAVDKINQDCRAAAPKTR